MATSSIRFILGLLFTIGSLSAIAQSPQAPDAPDRPVQPPGMIGPPVPLSQQRDVPNFPSVEQIMVLLAPVSKSTAQPISQWQRRLSDAVGVPLKHSGLHYIDDDGSQMHVYKLPKLMTKTNAEDLVMRIRLLPGVKHADIDGGSFGSGFAIPSDPLYLSSQWNLQSGAGGANLPPAWDLTTGKNTLVVAVIDSGILPAHPELAGRLLAGYDFITDSTRANDGDGRDANSADPGNWVTQAEANSGGISVGCEVGPSNWHGTGVAGVVGANANNAQGIAGVDWNVKILPTRVLGKCLSSGGGYSDTDLIAAIRWAAGLAVTGPPLNTNPAKVINISLGRSGACSVLMQDAINAARKKGAVVVASLGNTAGGSSLQNSPANCAGVVRVAATTRQGGLASYSNRGEAASISAPGGERDDNLLDKIHSSSDDGTTAPLNSGGIRTYHGTSFSAPHVAGVASLMLALRPKMCPQLIKHTLMNAARDFPTGTAFDCDTVTCGAGILDAETAVRLARSKHAGGIYHTAAVRSDGAVLTWGYNGNGQLGGGEAFGALRTSPGAPIAVLPNAADVASGYYHNVAAKTDGTVWTWGYNGQFQLGDGSGTDRASPVQVAGLTNVVAVAAGDRHTLALKEDGTVWAWGYNFFGQLGAGPFDFTDRSTPVQVAGLTDVLAIAGGGKRSMALKKDGSVWAWGERSDVSPDGTNASISAVPIQVSGLADIVAIAAGGESTTGVNEDVSMALTYDGKVYNWGYNDFGQLGIGNTSTKFSPQLVSTLPPAAVQISTGGNHTGALLEDGTLWMWGYNGEGALGDGTTTHRLSPVQVSAGLFKTVDIVAGPHHSLALAGDTALRAWGSNAGGQLGDGTQSNRLAPVQVHGQGNSGFYYAMRVPPARILVSA